MSLTPITKTFGALATEIKRLFGDESGVQLQDADIARWATEAQMDIASRLGAIKVKATLPAVVGQGKYTFPAENIHQVASIHFDNKLISHVPFIQAESIIISSSGSTSATGTPEVWYEWGGEFTLWPSPDTAGTITVYFSKYPDELTTDNDALLGLPDKFFSTIVNYIMMKCYEMDEDHQASQLAEGRYKEAIADRFGEERKGQDMAFPVIQEVDY